MNPIYTYRPFIHRERTDIDAYLQESQFWTDLYSLYLCIKEDLTYFNVSSVAVFNEVHYQCVRIMLDPHPEENIWDDYLNPAMEHLGNRKASDVCFSLVYACLSLVKDPPVQIPRFLSMVRKRKLQTVDYFPYCLSFVETHKNEPYDIDLTPQPAKPQKLPEYMEKFWKEVTDNFDQDAIRRIVGLWKTKEEQFDVMNIIKNAWNYDDLPF